MSGGGRSGEPPRPDPGGGEPVWLSWSGGKDSALTLHVLRASAEYRVERLLAVLPAAASSAAGQASHGVVPWAVRRQARALGLPLEKVSMPAPGEEGRYAERMGAAMRRAREAGVRKIAFGDIHLRSARTRRESKLRKAGMEPLFPLWGKDTGRLAVRFLEAGFSAVVTEVDTEAGLDERHLGRPFGRRFLGELPAGVDPCGEGGEFQTVVTAGPGFREPVSVRLGEARGEGRYRFRPVLRPAGRAAKAGAGSDA